MPDVWLITGIPGAGKSTVASLLTRRFERAAHVDAEALHDWILAGAVFPGEEPEDEMVRQLDLVARNACLLARSYVEAGFEAVIDYVIPTRARLELWLSFLEGVTVRFVVLNPGVDVAAERDADRDKSKRHMSRHGIPLAARWAYLQDELDAELANAGLWVASGTIGPEATVDAILAGREQALLSSP